jgi:hypothetical protein
LRDVMQNPAQISWFHECCVLYATAPARFNRGFRARCQESSVVTLSNASRVGRDALSSAANVPASCLSNLR